LDHNTIYYFCMIAGAIPYFAITTVLVHYIVRRARWKRTKRRSLPGFYPSSAGLGMAFLLTQTFYRPSVQHAIEARLVRDVEEDDQGDPETPAKHLNRQLKRIRRGEPVDSLILRL
jgi:hypothetical protein